MASTPALVSVSMADGSSQQADIQHIATQLNTQFDVPWVPEGMEQRFLEWLLAKIVPVIPAPLLSVIVDSADGLTADEVVHHEENLVALANELIDLPYLPEAIEASLIKPVVHQLLTFAVQGKALELAPKG